MVMASHNPVMVSELEATPTVASRLSELETGRVVADGASKSQTEDSVAGPPDEFAGFVANPAAYRRGGAATQAVRGHQSRGLLQRIADAEVNRFWRAEIAVREGE
jgi:hypothetical protein